MRDNAFTRELRLLTPSQFQRVFSNPVRVSSPEITLLAHFNDVEHPRLGLAIAKKSIKLACRRNRVKRIIRDSFRLNRHDFHAIDIVVISKRGIEDLSSTQLQQLIKTLWTKLNRRCKKALSA